MKNIYTQSQAIQEMILCSENPARFISQHVRIQDKPFTLEDRQNRYIQAIHQRNVLAKLPRQCGSTTMNAAYALHHATFKPNQSIVYMTERYSQAAVVKDLITDMHSSLPEWMRANIVHNTRDRIVFNNGCQIIFPTSLRAIRGHSINLMLIDQAFMLKGQDDLIHSVMPTLSACQGNLVAFGVPSNGAFYKEFKRAANGESNFHAFTFSLKELRAHQPEEMRAFFGEEAYNREFLCKIE